MQRTPSRPAAARRNADWDIAPLARVVDELSAGPLVTVGSGGSFSAAVFCAALHELHTHQLAKAVTPLAVASVTERLAAGVFCLSASGRNRDIRAAFSAAAALETRPLAAICLTAGSPLKALQVDFSFVDVVEAIVDIAPDGFLAVNSLFAMCVLLTRAYRLTSGENDALPESYEALIAQTDALTSLTIDRERWIESLTDRTVSLLYSPPLAAAAADLESRFVEGALGNIHAADWRNFGHGRHHWLAKRASGTTVVAMIGAADQTLVARTLDLLSATPTHSVRFDGAVDEQGLLAMLFALHLAELAGEAAGIDPGRPGVPEFGCRLYQLGPKFQPPSVRQAAITRKARARGQNLTPELDVAYEAAADRVRSARPCGVVFDYDGTLCDRRQRFIALPQDMADGLIRLAERGMAEERRVRGGNGSSRASFRRSSAWTEAVSYNARNRRGTPWKIEALRQGSVFRLDVNVLLARPGCPSLRLQHSAERKPSEQRRTFAARTLRQETTRCRLSRGDQGIAEAGQNGLRCLTTVAARRRRRTLPDRHAAPWARYSADHTT